MASLNKAILIGNVGKDPEIRYIEGGAERPKVALLTLATSENYKTKNGEKKSVTEWHNLVAYRSTADIIEKYVKKGSPIYVEGKIRTRQWEDNSGAKRYTTEIVVDSIQLLGGKPEHEEQKNAPAKPRTQETQPAYRESRMNEPRQRNVFEPQEDDLPF